MIDIHAHIIPGVDDGADDYDTALLMLQTAQESGVTDIIATPHANQRTRYENYVSDELDARLTILRTAAARAGLQVRLHAGMEVFGTPDLVPLLRAGKIRTLAGSRYLLVEFAFREDAYYMEQTLLRLRREGVEPIVAHPERYRAIQDMPDILFSWVEDGILLQVNKGSINGAFGRSAAKTAHMIFEYDLADLIASDAHGTDRRTTDLSRIREYITTHFSTRRAERLLTENPQRILRDEPIERRERRLF